MNPSKASVWRAGRTRGHRRRAGHVVLIGLEAGRVSCTDVSGIPAGRLRVEAGDEVTWYSDEHRWSIDFGKLSPFDVYGIEGSAGERVTLRVREDAFAGVEYRYFAALVLRQGQGARTVRDQPLIIVEPHGSPGW